MWTPKVGDIVLYKGNKHYVNANALIGSRCKGGKAKITEIYEGTSEVQKMVIAASVIGK